MNKVQKIHKEVKKLHGNPYYMMAVKDVLAIIDSLQEEPASIDFEQELYKAFGQVKDFTLGMRIAKWFYDMGKNGKEPVSVWHDANQQPTMFRKYLVRYSDGRVSGSWERHDDGFIPWKDVVKEHGFTHWCYVEDLLKL